MNLQADERRTSEAHRRAESPSHPFLMMVRQPRLRRVGLPVLVVLAATAAAGLVISRIERAHSDERAAADGQAAALRANDALKVLLEKTEARVENGLASPRLLAALNAQVDTETLRDLLLTEQWWEPFRKSVQGFGIIRAGTSLEVSSNLPPNLDLGSLVKQTRVDLHPASRFVTVDGQILAVAASSIALPGRDGLPVLVATQPIGVDALATVVDRARGAVGISDGAQILVGHAAPGRGPGDVAVLERAVDMPVPGTSAPDHADLIVTSLALDAGFRLLVLTRRSAQTGTLERFSSPVLVTLIAGLFVALLVVVVFLRRAVPVERPIERVNPTPSSPHSIGRYRLVDRIGQGGMADIFSAVTMGESGFRRPVVIKRLRSELAGDNAAVTQFRDEANLLATLHHPNIVAVQDFGLSGDQLFLAEEYVLGRTLGQLVRRLADQNRFLTVQVVAYICNELLKALEYAHGRRDATDGRPLGIVHRDASPENVMISREGAVKLLDFGIVQTTRVAKTDLGIVKGSVTFMSPEQARGLAIDSRADLYSVGLVIFFSLSARPLYESESMFDVLTKATSGPGPGEWEAVEALPPRVSVILRRAFAVEIDDRQQVAREMMMDLAPLIGDGAVQAVTLMEEVFGQELETEARHLHSFQKAQTAQTASGPQKVQGRRSV